MPNNLIDLNLKIRFLKIVEYADTVSYLLKICKIDILDLPNYNLKQFDGLFFRDFE